MDRGPSSPARLCKTGRDQIVPGQTPEIATLEFESMAQGGEALAHEANGRVVFVPYAIAGERARVEIVESRRGFARGRIVEILQPSSHRVVPRCPHFPPTPEPAGSLWCGGCQWQHIAYDAQLNFKTQIVRDQFTRVAKMPDAPVMPIIPAGNEWNYRNNMQFMVNQEGKLCLQAPGSHELVPILTCHIMDDLIGETFKTLELDPESFNGVTLRAGENTSQIFVILESDDPETPEIETDEPVSIAFRSGDTTLPILGKEFLAEIVGGRAFRISPDSFFQVNTAMALTLVNLVIEYLEPRATDTLLDGYCGVGLFGLSLAGRVARVIGIEENPQALEDARFNAREFDNLEFHEGPIALILPGLDSRIDLAVVDPPRAGLERSVLDALAVKGPRAVAYVSCDTATLARDAARLVERGYRLARVQPVDLFPQTHHIECVALFDRARESA